MRTVLLIAALALLASCASQPPPPAERVVAAADSAEAQRLEQLAASGQLLDAALAYTKLAMTVEPPRSEQYRLRAAELLAAGRYIPQAFQLLQELQPADLGPAFQARRAMLAADIALARQLPVEAMAALDTSEPLLAAEDTTLRLRYHRLRAKAAEQTGDALENARQRSLLEPLLSDDTEISANQQAILSALLTLSPETLDMVPANPPPDPFRGWLELARIGKTIAETRQDQTALYHWRGRFPNHPAREELIAGVMAARPQILQAPRQIALILPLNNRYAKAAGAVRNGFLAAYYTQQQAAQTEDAQITAVPRLRIYDESDNPADILAIYQRAVDEGAEFVVGPLDKDAVSQLAAQPSLPVPVLALNFSERLEALPENLFQLSLSPEDEARQVAERAWLDGHTRAAVITPSNSWGERVSKAFNERWLQLGGHVVEAQHYDPSQNDYSLPIRQLLNVDESQDRRDSLRWILGGKLEFIPRRRQDIDFIFMAAFSRQARLIRPQLRFHHAPKVPVYATSHAFGGSVDAQMDRDMDGVQFLDMPWTLLENSQHQARKIAISQAWPEDLNSYTTRLLALGIDAHDVISQLNGLRHDRSQFFPGETGELSLDMANRLQRRLLWARFRKGEPQVLRNY